MMDLKGAGAGGLKMTLVEPLSLGYIITHVLNRKPSSSNFVSRECPGLKSLINSAGQKEAAVAVTAGFKVKIHGLRKTLVYLCFPSYTIAHKSDRMLNSSDFVN
jgi:hypothetical protein